MDERDFAELISVFLKSGESDDTPNTVIDNEKDSTVPDMSSNEAEIRKNIIEALAEKIRESQDKNSSQSDRAGIIPSLEQEMDELKTAETAPEIVEAVETEAKTVAAVETKAAEVPIDNGPIPQESDRESVMESKVVDDFANGMQASEQTSMADVSKVETETRATATESIEASINDPINDDEIASANVLADVNLDMATASAAKDKEIIATSKDIVTEEEVATLLLGDNQKEIISLQRILDRFLKLDGIIAALLVSRDGFTVEHVSKIELDLDTISAVVATGFGYLDKIGIELDHSELRIAMLEYLNGPIIISPTAHDIVLVIVASQWATLGRIRLEIKKQTDELIFNL